MMKKAMMLTLVALFNLGVAHADTVKPNLGFDRVGMTADKDVTAQPARFTAPGEGRRSDEAVSPERKREMARRLVWLMLSAR
jgi:hypothetical protein